MDLRKHERSAVFIDGVSLYGAARSVGFDLDYKRLLSLFQEKTDLVRMSYYTVLADDDEYRPLVKLIDWLAFNGYNVVTKDGVQFTDSSGKLKCKGNIAVDLALDVAEMCDHLQHVILMLGSDEYWRLVEVLQRRGKRVTVVSTVKGTPRCCSEELRRQADQFIDLESLRVFIERAQPAVRPKLGAGSALV